MSADMEESPGEKRGSFSAAHIKKVFKYLLIATIAVATSKRARKMTCLIKSKFSFLLKSGCERSNQLKAGIDDALEQRFSARS